MSIDLSSYGSFATEPAPPAAAAARSEGQTLTLQLRFRRAADAMTGSISVRRQTAQAPNTQRAAVVAVDPAPLTITFEP